MKIVERIVFIISVPLSALLFGAIGLTIGAVYGGNNGCFEYSGLSGYESCGLFFGQLGVLIGVISGLALLLYIKRRKKA